MIYKITLTGLIIVIILHIVALAFGIATINIQLDTLYIQHEMTDYQLEHIQFLIEERCLDTSRSNQT